MSKATTKIFVSTLMGTIFLLLTDAEAREDRFGMGPPVTEEIVAKAVAAEPATADGPFEPTWESVEKNYKVPGWFRDGKFGIMMHWVLYSVPAYHNEWYQKHMYGNRSIQEWHTRNDGPVDQFGYKDFIPMFTVPEFDPDEWAELFERSGAKYVIPTAEHHDGFSLWDSEVTPWCAGKMGPNRDLIGELAKAVRAQGMKFGVSNHSIEHCTFIQPMEGVKTNLGDDLDKAFNDGTHHNNYGSYQLAKCVVQGIKDSKLDLARYIVSDFQDFDPQVPDMPDDFAMPTSVMSTRMKPLGD